VYLVGSQPQLSIIIKMVESSIGKNATLVLTVEERDYLGGICQDIARRTSAKNVVIRADTKKCSTSII
jgi:hypothetical protein